MKADADAAKASWLEAQSGYRTAQATKNSAKDAATYADGMYNKYATAVSEGQSQYDRDKPKLDEEMVSVCVFVCIHTHTHAHTHMYRGPAAGRAANS